MNIIRMCSVVEGESKIIVMLQQTKSSIRSGAKLHPADLHVYLHYEVVLILEMILLVWGLEKTSFHSEQKV
jgi:hypothetical protein